MESTVLEFFDDEGGDERILDLDERRLPHVLVTVSCQALRETAKQADRATPTLLMNTVSQTPAATLPFSMALSSYCGALQSRNEAPVGRGARNRAMTSPMEIGRSVALHVPLPEDCGAKRCPSTNPVGA